MKFLKNMFSDREIPKGGVAKRTGWIILLTIGLFLTGLLVGISYRYIQYNEYGIIVDKYTGKYDNNVYQAGPQFALLTKNVKTFPSTFKPISFKITSFMDSGIEVDILSSMQYRLPKDSVRHIYDKFSTNYEKIINTNAKKIVKNVVSQYSVDYMINNRKSIELVIGNAIKDDIQKIMQIEIPPEYYKILNIELSGTLLDTSLDTAIVLQNNDIQTKIQQISVINEETEYQKSLIEAQALQVTANANAEAERIVNSSSYDSDKIVSFARSEGLANLLSTLGINDPVDVNKVINLFALFDNDNVKLFSKNMDVIVKP